MISNKMLYTWISSLSNSSPSTLEHSRLSRSSFSFIKCMIMLSFLSISVDRTLNRSSIAERIFSPSASDDKCCEYEHVEHELSVKSKENMLQEHIFFTPDI